MKLSSAYIEDRFDGNYSEMKAPGIYRNIPDVDATVETNKIEPEMMLAMKTMYSNVIYILFISV